MGRRATVRPSSPRSGGPLREACNMKGCKKRGRTTCNRHVGRRFCCRIEGCPDVGEFCHEHSARAEKDAWRAYSSSLHFAVLSKFFGSGGEN